MAVIRKIEILTTVHEMYKRFTTIAGKTIIVRKTDSARIKTETQKRKPKTNPTPEAVAKINKINQERELTAKINGNFKAGDLWVTLSHPEGVDIETPMKEIKKFKNNIRNMAKRNGVKYKMIESTGIGEQKGKAHHHIVISKEITREMIIKYWPEEYVHIETLWSSGNYHRVAKYMLKNAYQSKGERGKHSKAYRSTKNIIMPVTKVEEMKRPASYDPEDIAPHDGYAVDRDSIRVYEHPITGVPCIEYIEVSLTEDPKIKKYKKGKIARKEKSYKEYWGEQLSIMDKLQI